MHTQRTVFKIFSIFSIILFSAQFAFAGNNAGFISSFKADNNNIFERSDVRMAVDHFCRMLSIDPGNKTVQENLKTISSHPELTAIQRSDVIRLEDHLSYIKNLQGRVEYLISKRNLLRDQLIENGHARAVLLKGLFDIRDNISGSHETFSYQKQSLFDRKSPLVIINNLLVDEKMQLSVRVRSLENQYDWLKAVNKDGAPRLEPGHLIAAGLQKDVKPDLHQETVAEIISLQPIRDEEGKVNEKRTEKFKKELGALYVQIDKLEEQITKEDDRAGELGSQVVDLSLKLLETEIQLNEKTGAVESLTAQLTDVEQRFVLGQRIIQEKDEEMQSLQEDLQKTRLETESRAAKHDRVIVGKDKELKMANGFLNIYRQRSGGANRVLQQKKEQHNSNLRKVVLERDQEINDLREQLGRMQKSLRTADRTVQEKVAYLNYAKNELVVLRKQMRVGEKEFKLEEPKYRAFPDEKVTELSGILRIYKDKLFEETKAAREKTSDITNLERQLALLENQLNEKSETLVKTQRDLYDLEDQLTALKQELLKLRERPQDKGSYNSDGDRQVQELQSKFLDINDFLLENLHDSDKIKSRQIVQ
ncbi:MAG: hypothetical protein KAJ70_00745 [Candidatus Omnitrophica bacterium]|nr:hypothetical protein [Candidatus Omnitrophota bacterium]